MTLCFHHYECLLYMILFLVRLLVYVVDCSASCSPANLSEVVYLVALLAFLSICWALSRFIHGSTVFVIFLCGHLTGVCSFLPVCFCSSLTACILSNSFISLRLLITTNWALWASTLYFHVNTSSLVTFAFSLAFVSLLIISANN